MSCRFVAFMACLLAGVTIATVRGEPALNSCGPGTEAAEGAPKDIPNDPQGRKGWLDEVQVDDAGNKLEVWCIKITGGVGNSYGYRYIPAGGGNPRWIARCAFKGGQNTDSKEPTGDANTNGKPDGWKGVKWTSEDDGGGGAGDPKDDDGAAGKKDWDWEYDVADNNLKKWETLDGTRINPGTPDSDGPPPEDFDDLFPTPPPDNPGQDDDGNQKPGVKGKLISHIGTTWSYELSGNSLTEFSPTMIYSGDSWSIAVYGVTAADAPSGWEAAFSSIYVTWTYVGPGAFDLSNDGPISGFELYSAESEGRVFWLSDSADDELANFGFAGTATGPVSDPGPTTGACCVPDGTCEEAIEQAFCESLGGTYQGDGTVCAEVECVEPIPTVSEWGLVLTGLLVVVIGILYGRRRAGVAAGPDNCA